MADSEKIIDLPERSTPEVEPVIGDIRQDWDRVRLGVEAILQANPKLSFRPEDVYAEVVAGHAIYWKAPEGFVVTSIEVDGFTSEKTFYIWLAWSERRGQKNVLKYQDFFKRVAHEVGTVALEVRTTVPDMKALLTTTGWYIEDVVYRYRLEDG
jgi:hypothetical protein